MGALRQQARANARLALTIALGEIQKDLGPDRSAAAPAAAVLSSPSEPYLTGVWESWAFDPTSTATAPDYSDEKSDLFKGWLVSASGSTGRYDPNLPASALTDSVNLVGSGSAVDPDGGDVKVNGGLVSVDSGSVSGQGYAWAALQEDTKAHLQPGAGDEPSTDQERFGNWFAQDESGLANLDFVGSLADDREIRQKAFTTSTISIAGGDVAISQNSFHHLSPWSRGVLADANNGGLRRDLTTEFENFSSSSLSGERLYDAGTGAEPWWDHLADYYDQAERVSTEGSGGESAIDIDDDLTPFTEISGTNTAPKRTVLTPVIARLDIVFSMVTHDLYSSAQTKYKTADPSYTHYSPWLVFEPVVTLWNPYNVPIEFSELKLYLDKIPVGMRFQKRMGRSWVPVRDPSTDTTDYWWPLSRYTWGSKSDHISDFFVRLRGGDMDGRIGGDVTLDPGETRVFTAYVSESSSWASVKDQFCITTSSTAESVVRNDGDGVSFAGGWNRTGGFQFDHLARWLEYRNTSSLYDFEKTMNNRTDWMWVALRGSDSFRARLRLMDNDNPDQDDSADNDTDRSFSMKVTMMSSKASSMDDDGQVVQDMSINVEDFHNLYEEGESKIIEHDIVAEEVYQSDSEKGPGGKSTFAVLSLTAKATRDLLHPTKGWLFGNPATANVALNEDEGAFPAQSYEMSFMEVFGSNSFPMVDVDVATETRGFFGPGHTSEYGLTAAPMFSLPREPLVSIGQFHTANILASSALPHFNYPVGNSYAHPLLAPDKVRDGDLFDHSFALNWALWDSYYFSSLSERADVQASTFAEGETPMNSRMVYYSGSGVSTDDAVDSMTTGSMDERSRSVAAHQMLQGPFNVNSTSVEAWKAVLSGLRDEAAINRDDSERSTDDKSPFTRFLPTITSADETLSIGGGSGTGGTESDRASRWVGLHVLEDDQIEELATQIVKQIKARGQEDGAPILTIGEFVNRRPGSDGSLHAQMGLLQTAISEAQKSVSLYDLDDGDEVVGDGTVANSGVLDGNTAEGSPAHLLQGDILQEIGSILTTHTDTLRIRCYGCAGEGEEKVEAWCEAIVQRMPEYVDPEADSPEDIPEDDSINGKFGRRYEIVSFRWLSGSEV
ncbi:MAG: hypothetical protein Q7R22_013455 [Verrucomicrobiota bacterium JB025]|nr:hypothetical protein [Verrucomicrobiota bacterium JB025]